MSRPWRNVGRPQARGDLIWTYEHEVVERLLKLDANKPESKFKPLGGGQMDELNERLNSLTVNALPIAYSKNNKSVT